jgi:membrane-bound metal-dependent hydrolase YbcI (DUF457 family)
MDPVTHALMSAALGRAGLNKSSRTAIPILVVAGTIADVDWLARLGSAETFLRWHRTVTHSLPGTAAIVLLIAAAFWLATRQSVKHATSFMVLLALSALAAGLHLAVDLAGDYGVKLLWPFRSNWYALGLVPELDFGILLILAACLFLPELLRLVSEEVRSKPEQGRPCRSAILALGLIALLIAGRAAAQRRTLATLQSREYRGEVPIAEVSLAPGQAFDPERAEVHFKPSPSPALTAAQGTLTAKEFLAFAKFPLASVEPAQDAFEVRLRNMRFASRPGRYQGIVAVIIVNPAGSVVEQRLEYAQPSGTGRR